ncbi:MAG: RecQ family ATP-dependent DNA helicase [Acidimicrobiales bacterium]
MTGHRLDSPFDHDANSLVILTNHLPVPVGRTEAAFCEALARDQAGFLSLTGGRSLVLFAARARMAATAAHLAPLRPALAERGVTLLVQGEHSPGAIQRRFRQDHGTALFGLRSYWEGFDAPGDTLSYLLIEKAPYGHPDEPITAARLRAIADAGGDPFADYTLPRAAIQLAQGFGRLLRTEHDRGVALIADPRLQTPSAANRFLLDSLPTTNVVHANGRDHAWTTAITFVTGHQPDLATALLRDHADLQSRLADLRLTDGEDPTAKLLDAARAFGVEKLRPEQLDIMRALLAGRDVLGFFPTGWGKSICFQLPALLAPAGRLTLVVSPLIALIKDQLDDLAGRRGLTNVVGLSSRAAKGHNAAQLQRIAAGQVNLLYVSPERLAHDPVLHRTLATIPLGAVVVDEAHCVSSWGFDFRPEFRQVAKAVATLPRTARAGLTATATEGVEADLRASLRLQDPLVLRQPASRSDLQFWVHRVGDDRDRARELLRFVLHQDGEPGLIYASRRALTEEIAWLLRQCGHRARAFHAGMRPDEKEHAQDDFLNGDTTIMVATKAFGMGVNKSDIGWVAHWDPPDGIDAYVQEAGRAARYPEAHGRCLLLYSDADLRRLARLIEREHAAENAGAAARLLVEVQTWPRRNGEHLVDGDELANRLQLDDDDLPSRMVAWLEDVGNVTRRTDAVATAMVAWHGREPADRAEQRRFFELRRLLGVRIGVRRRIDIDRAAARTGWDADELEAQLLDWSLTGLLTFVVTGRRWRIAVTDPHPQAAALRQLAGRWRDLQRNRLEHLQRYTTTAICRRATIAAVFGDPPVACRAGVDDLCDVCAGGPPPWHAVPLSMVPDPEQLIDAEHTVLQAVRWATRGTHRYGEATLGAALLGLETIGTAPITASLLRCPQFGAFRYVHDNRAAARHRRPAARRRVGAPHHLHRPQRPYPALELTDAGRSRTGGFRG